MSYRRVSYKSLITRIAANVAEPDGLSTIDAALANSFINSRLRGAWEYYFWPTLMQVEKRHFRPDHDIGTTYAAGAEVYWPGDGNYYQVINPDAAPVYPPDLSAWALCAGSYSTNVWSSTGTYAQGAKVVYAPNGKSYQRHGTGAGAGAPIYPAVWGELHPFKRTLDLEPTDVTITPIGSIKRIYSADPEVSPEQVSDIPFVLRGNTAIVRGDVNEVWVEFRPHCPLFEGSEWASGTTYAVGDQVYSSSQGDYFSAIAISTGVAVTDATKWARINFPYLLSEYVAQTVFGDMENKLDGQQDKMAMEQTFGFALLQQEIQNIERKQQQGGQLNVLTR